MTTQPKIELKNIKYAEFASEETFCFDATVWLDGKRFCTVSNQGHGGGDMQHPLKGGNYADLRLELDKLNKLIAETFPERVFTNAKDGFDGHYTEDLESICSGLVTQWLIGRDLKSAMRRKWIFQKTPDGSLFECKRQKGQKPETMLDVIRKKNPEAQLLNAMPETDALALWSAQG